MSWATDRRLDYIDWRLALEGEVQRADIMRVFGVSEQQASADLGAFDAAHPGAITYDRSRKRYVPAGRAKRRRSRIYDSAWATVDGQELDR